VTLELFRFETLSCVPGLVHGITTREGGVSSGRCASLNVSYSVGDAARNVDENLNRVASAFDTSRELLFSAYQVHGRAVTVVDDGSVANPRPRCDALVSRSREKTLMLRYADCTPVLLVDPARRAVGAVHAGWRGSAERAAAAAVEAMTDVFGTRPGDLLAGIGPAIGPCCYQVGREVVDAFGDRSELISEGRLDLWSANRLALEEAGVPSDQIELAGICTRCASDRFFSHRANGGQPAGRFAALIRLEG
jgi:YfiH family protein